MSTQKADIRAALMNRMVSGSFAYPVKWPNDDTFTTPNNAPWLRFTILTGASDMVTLSETDRQPIVVQVDIFTPKGSGSKTATDIADDVELLFSKKSPITHSGLRINIESFVARASGSETEWYRIICDITMIVYVARV